MKQKHADYRVVKYPRIRRLEAIAYRSIQYKSMMHGLIEIDVTRAHSFIREHKEKTGETLSFTAFLIACLAKAVDEHKAVQAYRKGGKRLILFEDVDVYTPVERDVAGQKQLMPYVIRAANRKTFLEIHYEIRAAQAQDATKAWESFKVLSLPWLLLLPVWRLMVWIGEKSPHVWKKTRGTVGITAIGMFGKGAGWGIPLPSHSLWITVGGIDKKPVLVDGQIVTRDYLSLTISFDHDIVDGAPAARFTQRLKELIESSYDLPGFAVEPQLAGAEDAPKCIRPAG